ncbi:hypothetical protein AKO1_005415 [Acrasis kona]|uniref:Uncharacterized protein n=1 Tax=Acrasis kona TaxID=1008807 RepID=A0AAW2YL47_9EUKA
MKDYNGEFTSKNNQIESNPSQTFRRTRLDPKTKAVYILEQSQDESLLYARTARLPKIGEPVIHITTDQKKIKRARVCELFSNGKVSIMYESFEERPVPVNQITWNAKGYWVFDESDLSPNTTNVHKKPAPTSTVFYSCSRKPQSVRSSEVALFTNNESWSSDFLMATDDAVNEKLVHRVGQQQQQQPKWTKLNENIPFRIFQMEEEFVIQPPKMHVPPVIPSLASASHQLVFTNTNKNGLAKFQSPPQHTFLTTIPDDEIVNNIPFNQSNEDKTLIDDAQSTMLTQGGMNVSVPTMLIPVKTRSSSAGRNKFKKKSLAKQWSIIPGKSKFVVHNPLENHPYTTNILKKETASKTIHEPLYTKSFSDQSPSLSIDKKSLVEHNILAGSASTGILPVSFPKLRSDRHLEPPVVRTLSTSLEIKSTRRK